MSDALIDPATGDYSLSGADIARDPANGLGNAVYLRLMTPQGSYWADPEMGSRLHELQREKDVRRVAVLAKQYAENALQPIVADGRAKTVDVTTCHAETGRLYLRIEVVASNGSLLTFSYPVSVI